MGTSIMHGCTHKDLYVYESGTLSGKVFIYFLFSGSHKSRRHLKQFASELCQAGIILGSSEPGRGRTTLDNTTTDCS
jgi:hypothetical protein